MLIKFNMFEYLISLFGLMSNNLLLNTIVNLTTDVIVTKILNQVLPFDLDFFLTSKHFHKLLEQYYQHLGITNIKSKNFIRALSAIMGRTTIFKHKSLEQQYVYCFLGYDVGVIQFANDITTTKMNNHWKLFIDLCKSEIKTDDENFRQRDDNSIKIQILLLMAHFAIEKYYGICLNTCNCYINDKYFYDLQYSIIRKMLKHNTDQIIKLHVPTLGDDGVSFGCSMRIAQTIELCADIVNVFYAMTGNKRAYDILYDYHMHYVCNECWNENRIYICICNCAHGLISNCKRFHKECIHNFYAIPKIKENISDENCFENPDWYNKIYTRVKCTKKPKPKQIIKTFCDSN